MSDTDVAAMIRECMIVTLKLGGPPLVVGLVVGLVVSLIQAITQINEATMAFLPKIFGIGLTMVVLGPFMTATLASFTHRIFEKIVVIGGS